MEFKTKKYKSLLIFACGILSGYLIAAISLRQELYVEKASGKQKTKLILFPFGKEYKLYTPFHPYFAKFSGGGGSGNKWMVYDVRGFFGNSQEFSNTRELVGDAQKIVRAQSLLIQADYADFFDLEKRKEISKTFYDTLMRESPDAAYQYANRVFDASTHVMTTDNLSDHTNQGTDKLSSPE